MRTDFFVTVITPVLNTSSTLGPYVSREECKMMINKNNKNIFTKAQVTQVADDSITYTQGKLSIKYIIFSKTINN